MSILIILNVNFFLAVITLLGLRFLVQLCKDMGLPYDQYAGRLRELERMQEAEQARYDFQPDVIIDKCIYLNRSISRTQEPIKIMNFRMTM